MVLMMMIIIFIINIVGWDLGLKYVSKALLWGEIWGWSMSLSIYRGTGVPMQSATGEDRGRWWNRGRGGSPTLRCYQEQEREEQEQEKEEETEYEKEEKEEEEKMEMVFHIKMLSGVHCPLPPSRGGQRGDEGKIKLHKSLSATFKIQDSPPKSSPQPKSGPIFCFAPTKFRLFTLFWFELIKCNHLQASWIQVILTSYQILFIAMDVFEAISVEHSASVRLCRNFTSIRL